eukprot:tig00000194_g14755.t1
MNSTQSQPLHLQRNGKRAQLERERSAKIDKENAILVDKLNKIFIGPSRQTSASAGPKSLNIGARRKQAQTITAENQRMLKRLQSIKPSVTANAQLREERRQNLEYMNRRRAVRPGASTLTRPRSVDARVAGNTVPMQHTGLTQQPQWPDAAQWDEEEYDDELEYY